MNKSTILTTSILMISLFLISSVSADCSLNLPPGQVNMVAVDGTTCYFDITLSSVPPGYDVTNGVYLGWCIDRSVTMPRGDTFAVMLYSSCNPPSDPALDGYEWDKVNYILNNKPSTATIDEIQQAIWNYVNLAGPYTPTLTGALAIVADAEAYGDGFVPGPSEVVAVILMPVDPDLPEPAQATIIELTIPPRMPGYTPGFWKHNIGVYLGENPGKYSAFEDTGIKLTGPMLLGYNATVGVTLEEAYAALTARGPGSNTIRADMANAFNDAAGYGPFED